MKKILVLFTGGTIGSITTDGIIDVEREGKYAVVEAYKSAYGDDVEFECRQVLNILSENMGFSGWEKMIHEINSIDTALYSGVILTHGSDTLAYTSALLGMYFRHFDIPLFIIASNKPIGENSVVPIPNAPIASASSSISTRRRMKSVRRKITHP